MRAMYREPSAGPRFARHRSSRLAWRRLALAGSLLLILAACARSAETEKSSASTSSPPAPPKVVFTDVTRQTGITFVHNSGAFGRKYLPETMGSGVAFLDYDGDGRQDLYFVNSMDWPGHRKKESLPALYRNKGDGTFEDVTRKAGLAVESYGIGVAAADYDNDGRVDLFVNALGPDHLFHNRGDGTFEDVTARSGVSDPAFGSSATWLDYDRDGFLDLFTCNYVQWSESTDIFCTLDGVNKSYCTPESYRGATNRLFRNRGDGTFEDVSRRAGVLNPSGKSLGVVAFDYDDDGWPDLAVANDTQPNFLYHNRRDGSFEEIGVSAGIGFGEDGKARGAMGIDAADYDASGRDSLLIGNFANEMLALYRNAGKGVFLDEAPVSGIGQPSLLTLAFGCFFFDYDLDSRQDIFVANGHVETDIEKVQPSVTYAEPPHLFWNMGGGRFESALRESGEALAVPRVGRGAAYADFDGDGDLDMAMTTNNGAAVLLRNEGKTGNDWIRIQLSGGASNRDALGARVTLKAGPLTETRWLRSSSSYASQSERVLTFGLGTPRGRGAGGIVEVEVVWPDGKTQRFPALAPGKLHILEKAP
jgi:enediyne biosynthesis protein E4